VSRTERPPVVPPGPSPDRSRVPGVAVPADVLVPFRAAGGRALMLGHVHPDADVLGTLLGIGLALEARGWSVAYGGPHPAPGVLRFLPGVERYRTIDGVDGSLDLVVLTDCPNPDRTEGLLETARRAARTTVNIDHHPDNRRYGDVNWVDPGAAATGELAYALLIALGDPISPAIATNLFTAIHTDTGSFRYSNVTPTTFQIAAALTEAGADPALVASSLYERREPEALRWLGEALGRVRLSDDGAVSWLALPAGLVPESFVESEDLVNYPRSVGSVRVACLFRERDGRVKVSLRGKGDVDVHRIAAAFGGGGHPNAAGCSVAGTLEAVTDAVLTAVREALRRDGPR
jgi:phosphoesterase RecJ-like protein